MTEAHLDLQSQLDSQNISNISDPSNTSLCNTSPILFLSPVEPTNNPTERTEINNTVSEFTDNNDVPSQLQKPFEQPMSTSTFKKEI